MLGCSWEDIYIVHRCLFSNVLGQKSNMTSFFIQVFKQPFLGKKVLDIWKLKKSIPLPAIVPFLPTSISPEDNTGKREREKTKTFYFSTYSIEIALSILPTTISTTTCALLTMKYSFSSSSLPVPFFTNQPQFDCSWMVVYGCSVFLWISTVTFRYSDVALRLQNLTFSSG